MEVGAPFTWTRIFLPRFKGVFEIEVARELAVALFDRLGQVDSVGKAFERFDFFISGLRVPAAQPLLAA